MNTQINIQDIFLNKARVKKIPLVVYLVNGFQFKGTVKAFDNFTVVMENEHGQQSLVYKHAISTVIPASDIECRFVNDVLQNQKSSPLSLKALI